MRAVGPRRVGDQRRINERMGNVRSDQTYAAPDASPPPFVTSRVQSAFGTGPPALRRFPKQGDLSPRTVAVDHHESRKTASLVAVGRRHFSRQVRSANDVSKPLTGEAGDHFGLRDAWYVARSLARSAVYYN